MENISIKLSDIDDNKNTITASISQLNGDKIEKFTFRDKNSIEKAIQEG